MRAGGEAATAPRCAASDAGSPGASAGPAGGKRTPLDGVYRLTTTRKDVRGAAGGRVGETVSENYGQWRYVFDRGRLRYTQSSEGPAGGRAADLHRQGHV